MMHRLTHLGGARATLAVGFTLTALGDRRVGLATLLANALSHVMVQALKRAVARPRPCDANGAPLALIELPDPHYLSIRAVHGGDCRGGNARPRESQTRSIRPPARRHSRLLARRPPSASRE